MEAEEPSLCFSWKQKNRPFASLCFYKGETPRLSSTNHGMVPLLTAVLVMAGISIAMAVQN